MTKSLWTLALIAGLAGAAQAQIRTPQASPMAAISQGVGLDKG